MTAPPRVDAAAVRRTLRAAGLRARSSMSQNFLVDPEVLEAILAEAAPEPGGRVLEIGPGLGILTAACSTPGRRSPRSSSTGASPRSSPSDLAEPVAAGRLTLIEGDALDEDLTELVEPPYDVVANLPYHITSPILHRLLGETPRPRRLVLMVQREVAERIAAPPGQMSYLSVFVQYHAKVRIAFKVPPSAFEPEPAVDSAVIVVEPYPDDDRLAEPRGRGRAVAPRPGRRSGSAARCSTTSSRGSSPWSRPGSTPRSRPPASPRTAGPRPWRWGSGSRCSRRSATIGPDQRGRRRE